MNKKTMNWKRVSFGFSLIILVLSALVIYQVYSQSSSPTTPMWLSGGDYPGAPAFTIFKDNSNYFAKNSNGALQFSSDNASDVIQSAIDTLTYVEWGNGGGRIQLLDGQFELTAKLTLRKQVELFGLGMHKTCLKFPKSAVGNLGNMIDVYGFSAIKDMEINGEASYQTYNIDGIIFIKGEQEFYMQNVYLHNFNGTGVRLDGDGVSQSFETWFRNDIIEWNKEYGIYSTSADVWITDCDLQYNSFDGANFDGWGSIYIENVHAGGNGYNGLNLGASSDMFVNNVRADANNKSGIRVATVGFTQISNVRIQYSGITTAWVAGILIDGAQNTTITNAVIEGWAFQDWGLKENGGADKNVYVGIRAFNGMTGGIETVGADTKCNLCWNETVWIP